MLDWLPSAYITRDSADRVWLKYAYDHAAQNSCDPDTHNGAVLVYRQTVVGLGSNAIPPGVERLSQRLERPEKYTWIEHAERSAIFDAARRGSGSSQATLYCPWYACADCARGIICAGIKRVVGHLQMMQKTPDRWRQSIQCAFIMLKEANVHTDLYDGQIGDCKALFDRQIWEP